MIETYCYDVECLRNFFSVTFVQMKSYLEIFKDCVDSKGKPIPLIQKLSVVEIEERLNKVTKLQMYVTDTDTAWFRTMVKFLFDLHPHYDMKNKPVRYDVFGYNSSNYDKLMISALLMYMEQYEKIPDLLYKLYETSKHIIDIQNNKDKMRKDYQLISLQGYKIPFVNIDLMSLFALNKCGKGEDKDGNIMYFPKSLKQTSINLQWYQLLDYQMPVIEDGEELSLYYSKYPLLKDLSGEKITAKFNEWDRYVMPKHIPDMLKYNANDVFICCEMIRLYVDEIRLRYNLSSSYRINMLSSSRSDCADKLFTHLYSKFSGLKEYEWKDKKTERSTLAFNKAIFPTIKFQTKELQNVLKELKKVVVYHMTKKAFSKEITIGNMVYTIATGGLHTQDKPRQLKSKIKTIDGSPVGKEIDWNKLTDDSYVYVHQDVTSFYPSLIIEYGICPAHMIQKAFVALVKYLKDTRVRAKHSKEKTIDGVDAGLMAQALKITINSIYGKFGYKYGSLYDRMASLKVTINGQLMIIMLCERLELAGIEVMSANTDGIVVKLYKSHKKIFDEIIDTWQKETRMDSDSEEYKLYINRDINNYICQEFNGKFTFKGALNPMMYAIDLQKGYDMPIVATAVLNYFVYDKPVMETFKEATNILDFCKAQNVSNKYIMEICEGVEYKQIQKNVRFYASNTGVMIYKKAKNEKALSQYVSLCANQPVTILNTLDDKPIAERNIAYGYYRKKAMEIIDSISLGKDAKKVNQQKISRFYNTLFDDAKETF